MSSQDIHSYVHDTNKFNTDSNFPKLTFAVLKEDIYFMDPKRKRQTNNSFTKRMKVKGTTKDPSVLNDQLIRKRCE